MITSTIKDREQTIKDIMKTAADAVSEKSYSTTYWNNIGYDDKGNNYAVAFGWTEEDDTRFLCGKMAYISKKSAMCEYDIDFYMPYDENGEVDDTEIAYEEKTLNRTEPFSKEDIEWFLNEFDRCVSLENKKEIKREAERD